jgi:hypothetical protein
MQGPAVLTQLLVLDAGWMLILSSLLERLGQQLLRA